MLERDIDRILYISPGGIGNLLLSLPALRALRAEFPRARLTLFTIEPGVDRILQGENVIDDVICCRGGMRGRWLEIWQALSRIKSADFDLGLTAGTVNPLSAGFLMWLLGIPIRVGENIKNMGLFYTTPVPYRFPCHETAGALNIVEYLGVRPLARVPELRISELEEADAEAFLTRRGWKPTDNLIGIHPGASLHAGAKRRWPAENFVKLIQALHQKGARVLVVAGPAEREAAADIVRRSGVPVINTNAELSLRHTAAVIQRCRQFISNDSGVAHIAAAVGTQLVVMFGVTDPRRTAPKGKYVFVIKTPGQAPVASITVEEVLGALNRF